MLPVNAQSKYMPQLDGLRALAVCFVLLHHWCTYPLPKVFGVDFGRLGVSIFFVLSGFLITGILLSVRDISATPGRKLSVFWFRRVLRIFPLYYAVLVMGWLCAVPGIVEFVKWHFSYLSNVLIWARGGSLEDLEYAAHFWTCLLYTSPSPRDS